MVYITVSFENWSYSSVRNEIRWYVLPKPFDGDAALMATKGDKGNVDGCAAAAVEMGIVGTIHTFELEFQAPRLVA